MSGLAQVTSPPYDVIAAENEDQLMAADPHNIVRLILPRPLDGQPDSPYRHAAAELGCWLADGILAADPAPALYVYEQAIGAAAVLDSPVQVIQRGLIGALGLVPLGAGIVQPHEGVAPGPVAGRRQLMEATQANLEPIFLLYEGDHGAASSLVDQVATARLPLAEAFTGDGLRHRLWAITDAAELAAIAADLSPRTALIADGHHRYAAYLQLQDRRQAAGAGPGPWDCGLALLVDSAAYPPRLGPIHRVLEGLVPAVAVRLASTAFDVRELPGGTARPEEALAELAAAGDRGIAFLISGGERAYLLTNPDPTLLSNAVQGQPPSLWQQLPAAVLQDLLLGRIWGIEDDDRTVRAVHDPLAAMRSADGTPGGTAVLCCPMTPRQVYEVASLGMKVPRKSTSFGPKPRTGLVLRLFAES